MCFSVNTSYPIFGTLLTIPSLLTQTQTLSLRRSVVTTDPRGTIIAFTEGFSLSIVASATVPCTPTNSGHENLPAHKSASNYNNIYTVVLKQRRRKKFL